MTTTFEGPGTDTHSLSFTDRTWNVITAMAEANTDGNRSRFLELLVQQAALMPEEYGLVPPGEEIVKKTIPERVWGAISRLADANTQGDRGRLIALLAAEAQIRPQMFGLKESREEPEPSVSATMAARLSQEVGA